MTKKKRRRLAAMPSSDEDSEEEKHARNFLDDWKHWDWRKFKFQFHADQIRVCRYALTYARNRKFIANWETGLGTSFVLVLFLCPSITDSVSQAKHHWVFYGPNLKCAICGANHKLNPVA
jgi:hypothetical protein